MSDPENDYSHLTDLEERMFMFGSIFLTTIVIIVAVIIQGFLIRDLKLCNNDDNKYYQYAIKSAMLSLSFYIFMYIIVIFLCNDIFIPWKYTTSNRGATILDSVFTFLFVVGKVSFYFAFTFHVQSAFYSNSKNANMPKILKLFMIAICVIYFIIATAFCIDDALESSSKEIGITSTHNIHLTMWLSHKGAVISQLISFVIIIFDIIYFVVLLYLYISKLKKFPDYQTENAVKGLVLVVISCVVFWIACIFIGLNSPFKYPFAVLTILSDVICLFLMSKSGDNIYKPLCGSCGWNKWCNKKIFGVEVLDDGDNNDALSKL